MTNSRRPVLYRIDADDRKTDGVETLPVFTTFEPSEVPYLPAPAFNLGGIAASQDGRWLILAHSALRTLYRLSVEDGSVEPIDLHGEQVGADGLVLRGRTLFAVERQGLNQNAWVVKIRLKGQLDEGRVLSRTSDPTFNDPTTAALIGPWLLVVNSQFGERASGAPTAPFTVSRVRAR